MKNSMKENKVDDMFDDIQTGTGWASYDYILNSKHSPLSKKERIKLLLKLSKIGILVDDDKLSGKEQEKSQIPQNAFMSLQDLERKIKVRTSPNNEIMEDKVSGGLADKLTLPDIANKHKVDIDELVKEFRLGVKVEKEHTSDVNIASEIARDHLFEDPNYYTKLATIENESVNESNPKITMNNLDWGKSTAERNTNLDKHKSLKTDKEKQEFLRKLKGESINEVDSREENDAIEFYTLGKVGPELHKKFKGKFNLNIFNQVLEGIIKKVSSRTSNTKIFAVIKIWCRNLNLDPKKYIGGSFIEDEEFIMDAQKQAEKYYNIFISNQNESVNESINVKDYEPVHGSYGFDKLSKLADTKNTIKISKSEFASILKVLKKTGTDVLKKINTEEYYTIYSLGNDYNLVKLQMKNEGLNEDVKNDLMSGGMKTWWKYDKKDVMSFVYWLQRQIPPTGPKFDKEWKNVAAQLNKKHPAPKDEYERVLNESVVSKKRAQSDLKQKLSGKRSDGMGKYTGNVYGIDDSGKRVELKSLNDLNKYTKFELGENVDESINELSLSTSKKIKELVKSFNNTRFGKFHKVTSGGDRIDFDFKASKFAKDGIQRELDKMFPKSHITFVKSGDNYKVGILGNGVDESMLMENPYMQQAMRKQIAKKKVYNPRTKKQISVQSALGDTQHPAYKKALAIKNSIVNTLKSKFSKKQEESVINELDKFSSKQVDVLKKGYGSIEKINPSSPTYKKLTTLLDSLSLSKLKQLSKADIKWVSMLARNRVNRWKKQNEIVNEEDKTDTVTMDVPLFIRSLEYSKEDAKTDMDLHDFAEKAIELTKQKGTLSMDSYDTLVGSKSTDETVNEAKFGYKDSSSSYITDHNNEYKLAKSTYKKVGGDEIKFYDALETIHDKLGHPKYMKWVSNALRGYNVDMYKDPKIKNKAEAEEALYLLSK